jgi:hypothetical protein
MGLGGTRVGVRGAVSLQRQHAQRASERPSAVKERTVREQNHVTSSFCTESSLFAPFFKTDLPSLKKSRQFLC